MKNVIVKKKKKSAHSGSFTTLCRKSLVLSRGRSLYDDLKTVSEWKKNPANSILHMGEDLILLFQRSNVMSDY